jgi:flagellar basal body L-ring protein FlgH
MTRRQWIGFCLLTAGVVPVNRGFADSIWDRRDHRSAYLFIDNKARRVGDLLTVSVKESTGATNNEQRKLKKDTAASGKFDFAGKTSGTGVPWQRRIRK